MEERVGKKLSKQIGEDAVEFGLVNEAGPGSSLGGSSVGEIPVDPIGAAAPEIASGIAGKYSPEFLELAAPKLPPLTKGNLARLLMQSPNRLYFYWSIGRNPFHTLSRALGQPGNYTLVLKLINLRTGEEQIHPIEEKGNWWFDVDADSEHRAEIGFYAVNRPYIRILYSNAVTTPRKGPSPRTADAAEWRIPAQKFARVLDAAGFARDAFDVALAGDDIEAADSATRSAFAEFTGRPHADFADLQPDELRYAMLALASGISLEELRGLVSDRVFALLSGMAEVDGEKALAAMQARFEFDAEEFEIEEGAEAVFAGSLVNFPRRIRQRGRFPQAGPLSSFVLGK